MTVIGMNKEDMEDYEEAVRTLQTTTETVSRKDVLKQMEEQE